MFHKRVYTDRVALPPHDMHSAGVVRSVMVILCLLRGEGEVLKVVVG